MIVFLAVFVGGGAVDLAMLFALRNSGQGGAIVWLVVSIGWLLAVIMVFFAILTLISTVRVKINSRY
jgi:hypothetical protein